MKNKQKAVLKILVLIPLLFLSIVHSIKGQSLDKILVTADSLFSQRQYTQSLELYKEILAHDAYSESVLLKMAFIEEGLGRVSESLYYLNLYYLASDDPTALSKIEEVANQHKLFGYKPTQGRQIQFLLRSSYDLITKIIVGFICLLFGVAVYQKRRQKNPMPVAIVLLAALGVFFLHVNFSQQTSLGIINANSTYLMSGPSAGASVVDIVGEGHMLDLLDKKDVWIHVKWMNQDAYIKEDKVLEIEL